MFLISNYSSATWPPDVRRLALTYMQDPFQVCVGSLDLKVSYEYYIYIVPRVYCMAGNFRGVLIFVIFVVDLVVTNFSHPRK